MTEQTNERLEQQKRDEALAAQWKSIQVSYPLAIKDLFEYIDGVRSLYVKAGEDRELAGLPLNDHDIAAYLQRGAGADMIKTYIESRIDPDVAQPIKK